VNGRFNETHPMNMKSHLYSLKSLAAVCLALALPLSQASAQKRSQPATTQPSGNYQLEVTIDSAGGHLFHDGKETPATLGNAIDVLRQQHPELTFALSPGLSDVKLSELKLQANDVDQTLEALRLSCGNRFVFAAPSHMPDGNRDGMRTLYLLQGDEPRNRRRMVEAFNLGSWISEAGSQHEKEVRVGRVEEIIFATIEKWKQMSLDSADRPEFLYHPEGNIMVVIGAPEAIEIAGKIIRAMNPGMAVNYGGGGMPGMAPGQFGGGGVGYSTPFPQQPNAFGGGSVGQSLPVSQPGHPPESANPAAPAPRPGSAPR
jgi:hypothetical protein